MTFETNTENHAMIFIMMMEDGTKMMGFRLIARSEIASRIITRIDPGKKKEDEDFDLVCGWFFTSIALTNFANENGIEDYSVSIDGWMMKRLLGCTGDVRKKMDEILSRQETK